MKQNIIKRLKFGASLCASMLVMASCTNNFEEMNRQTGEPTRPEFAAYLKTALLSQMIDNVYSSHENSYQMNQNLIGDPYGRYLSIANSNFNPSFSTFNAPDGWVNYPFEDVMVKFYTNWTDFKKMAEEEDLPHFYAWSQILRVAAMQRLTDMYGPIPYSKVATGGIASAYDSQEDAYKTMLLELTEAIDVLTVFIGDSSNPQVLLPKGDRMYGGKIIEWVKFANSMKLRMAMRMVYAEPALAKQYAEEAVNHSIGLITESVTEGTRANPVWKMVTNWGDSRPAADIVSYLVGYNDPRLEAYFTESKVGVGVSGVNQATLPKYLGLRTGVPLPEKAETAKYSAVQYAEDAPMLWMPASEMVFLKAEGALRGWNMGGSAAQLYAEAVELSFKQWKVEGAATYLNDATSKPANYVHPVDNTTPKLSVNALSTITVKWSDGDNFETKLERIMTQKWLAMYPLGMEAWSEQRRTGYPKFFPVLVNANTDTNLTTRLASRIPFPPSEKEKNTANFNDAVTKLGGPNAYGTKLWWDQNPNKGW